MRKTSTVIKLTKEEKQSLEETARTRTAPRRAVQRARIILLASKEMAITQIAKEVGMSRATVVLWRQRFGKGRLDGLQEVPRLGPTPKYGKTTEKRILAQLDNPPPPGYSSWTGKLVAKALGDVSSIKSGRYLINMAFTFSVVIVGV